MKPTSQGRGYGSAPAITLIYLRQPGAQHGYAIVQTGERFFVEERSSATRPVRFSILRETAQRILALPSAEALTELWRTYHAARLARRAASIGDHHARQESSS